MCYSHITHYTTQYTHRTEKKKYWQLTINKWLRNSSWLPGWFLSRTRPRLVWLKGHLSRSKPTLDRYAFRYKPVQARSCLLKFGLKPAFVKLLSVHFLAYTGSSSENDLTQSIVKSDPVRRRLVLIFSSTGYLDNSTEHFLKQTDKNNFNVCIHSIWNCMGSTDL
jgi:hypothetical protein